MSIYTCSRLAEGVFRLNKKPWIIPLSAIIALVLTGCANDDQAASDKNDRNAQPMGYYSNENHQNGRNGMPGDNDGPLPEAMDHTFGDEGQINNENRRQQMQKRDENGNPPNPSKPLADHDHNFFQRDNRFSTSDVNYHGHMSRRLGTTGTTTNRENQDAATDNIRRRVAAVENVRSVRSVVYGNTVVISVILNDNDRADETKREIQNTVKPIVAGRDIQVMTDEGAMGRDRNRHSDKQRIEEIGP